MEEKNKYNQCLLLNGYEFLDFENTKNTTLKEWLKDENFLLFIKRIAKELEEMQKEKERRNILKTNQELILKKIGE